MSAGPDGPRPLVELFTTGPGCSLCERTLADLEVLATRFAFRLVLRPLGASEVPAADYVWRVPVVHVDGRRVAEGRIPPEALEVALRAAPGGGAPGR
ncbi:MAG: glutaredoxin family protein [Thermoleophilia bacterium]